MADIGDFKEPTPAMAETFSMPPRDPSLDDFEKLESFCTQDKPDNESQFKHDILGSGYQNSSPTPPDTFRPKESPIIDDFIKPTKLYQEEEAPDKNNKLPSSAGSDPFTELLDFRGSNDSPQVVSTGQSGYNNSSSLLDFDIPAAVPSHEIVSSSASTLLDDEDDFKPSSAGSVEKLVHPQQTPSDSSPSDETAAGNESPVEILPSAPEIAHLVSAADSLVSGQLQRRPPSPVEIPRQTPIIETVVPSSTVTYSPKKMSNDEVSSTKEQGTRGCPFSPSALFDPKRLHPFVTQLVYWQDPKKSGGVFGSLLLLLLSLRFFSFISVVSYLALGGLSVTLSFRIYKNILQAVQKSNDGHPFKDYLEYDLSVPQDKVHETADTLVKHVNCTLQKVRSLFLIEDLVDSIKLGIVLWTLTYLGAWFNGLTLIILGVIATFTLPKVYESNQALIDQYLSLVGAQVSGVLNVVKSKIPFGKKEKSQ